MGHGFSAGLQVCGYAEALIPLVRPADSRGSNDVFKGFAVLPDGKTRAQVVVKLFQHGSRLRIYNEVVAHHVAVQCGVPSPYTFPCACPTADLLRNGAKLGPEMLASDFILGVASYDVSPKKLNQVLKSSDAVEHDILVWPKCVQTALFDELVANSDRHVSNLIRQGPGDYRAIDHEGIMFGDDYFGIESLLDYAPRNSRGNCLLQTIARCTDEVLQQRLRHHAQLLLREMLLDVPSVSEGLERLCHAPLGITDRLIAMLNIRRTHLPRLVQFYFEERSLFRASSG